MKLLHFLVGVSAVLALIAGGLQLAPLQSQVQKAPKLEASPSLASVNFAAIAARFDASGLPAPTAPEPIVSPPPPPPDPAAQLKRYRFIGLAKSDARAAGVFERNGAVAVVAIGSSLEGFKLLDLGEQGALFVNGDNTETRLPLETKPAP